MRADWFEYRADPSSKAPISGDDTLISEVSVPAKAFWFDGHFPSSPILPAVAQIGLVAAILEKAIGSKIRVSKVRRVRFKKIIRPDELLRVSISTASRTPRSGAKSYEFRITSADEAACSGFFECFDG